MKFVNKDITTIDAPAIILHGVNSQGVMASGVAKAIAQKWLIVREHYLGLKVSDMHLGKIQAVEISSNFFVINCWTQDKYGYDGQAYADAKGIGRCLEAVAVLALDLKIYDLYAPPIGCGLGGLDWDKDVFPLFSEIETKNPQLKFTICDIKIK